MVAIIVNTPEEITTFNNGITPLMLDAGQIMERWVDEEQCPHNAVTGQYAIVTECSGTRRDVMLQYLAANGLVEVEVSQDDTDWFPPMPEMFNSRDEAKAALGVSDPVLPEGPEMLELPGGEL